MAHACQSLGWDWDTARSQLDFPRLRALGKYWKSSPPPHLLIAGYVGYKPQADAPQPAQPDDTGEILDMLIDPE